MKPVASLEDFMSRTPEHANSVTERAGRSDLRYCTLTLHASRVEGSSRDENSPKPGEIVLLAIKPATRGIAIFVSPEILRIVRGDDFLYIRDLISNLPHMAKRYPDLLFECLSSISAGPLRTCEVGKFDADHSDLPLMWSHLVGLNLIEYASVLSAHRQTERFEAA